MWRRQEHLEGSEQRAGIVVTVGSVVPPQEEHQWRMQPQQEQVDLEGEGGLGEQ